MKINESISKIRKAKGYSQVQIAEILQTTQQQYSKYETGLQAIPVIHIIKLCEVYRLSADELLGIKTFMTKEEGSLKFNKLYEEITDILYWAKGQQHINDYQLDILLENIERSKYEIENE